MRLDKSLATAVAAVLGLASRAAEAKSIYAHFMVSGIDTRTDHAKQDIESAQNMGFDGFALNIKEPNANWAIECIEQLFEAAQGTGFKLFFSIDMNGNDDVSQFTSLFDYFEEEAYLKIGDEGKPFLSTFWGGNIGKEPWQQLKTDYNIYFVPSFDDTPGYYDNPPSFFDYWSDVVDGAFNWETAWPQGSGKPENVSSDVDAAFLEAAHNVDMEFMMAMSPLQYKHCCGGNYYRVGEGNMPERMTQILDLKPDRVEFITWNDGGESHYIGNLWEEAFESSPEIVAYANNEDFPHFAWQPLISSFIKALKDGKDASQMTPPGDSPIGAMWYRGVLKSCDSDSPDNADAALDAVNYAFVFPESFEGATIRVTSGGKKLVEREAVAGLNYGTVGDMGTGAQKVDILRGGSVVATAEGKVDVQATMEGFCNFNYYVNGLEIQNDAGVSEKNQNESDVSGEVQDDAGVSEEIQDDSDVSGEAQDDSDVSEEVQDDADVSGETKPAGVSGKNKPTGVSGKNKPTGVSGKNKPTGVSKKTKPRKGACSKRS